MKAYDVKELRVPVAESNAVTAMALGDDGLLYCGLTGKRRVLAALDPRDDSIRDLGEVFPDDPKTRGILDKIHNALVKAPDGSLYIGQGLNVSDAYPRDFHNHGYEGGRLFRYEPGAGRFTDLGPQVRGEAIQGMVMDPRGRYIAGYTIPGNHFFVHDLASRTVTDYGRISQMAHHNLVCDAAGVTWGCWNCALAPKGAPVRTDGCYLMRYEHERRLFERTTIEVPTEPFRNVSPAKNKSWNNGFDSACCARDGTIYFGTSLPANLCRFKPGDGKVELLGRPVRSSRIPALAEAGDGRIIGFGGFPQMQLFVFDPRKRKLENHGVVLPHYKLCIFHAMVVLPDGRIYAGETDSGRANIYCLTPRSAKR
jgi:sugar lactone lactonase YvrE